MATHDAVGTGGLPRLQRTNWHEPALCHGTVSWPDVEQQRREDRRDACRHLTILVPILGSSTKIQKKLQLHHPGKAASQMNSRYPSKVQIKCTHHTTISRDQNKKELVVPNRDETVQQDQP